jgi:Flp pilus assembly protein TadG
MPAPTCSIAVDEPVMLAPFARRLNRDRRGVALMEFAVMLPALVLLCLGGMELANFITTKMRISQIALQIADNAARIGSGTPLAAKTISENDVNDLFVGAQTASGKLNLRDNGRVVLSDLEPQASPNPANKYKIAWQRCYGTQVHPSTYGNAGATNLAGMGPPGRLVTAQDDNATIFVEVFYVYKPIVGLTWTPATDMVEIASMAVRDRRDLPKGLTNDEKVTPSAC